MKEAISLSFLSSKTARRRSANVQITSVSDVDGFFSGDFLVAISHPVNSTNEDTRFLGYILDNANVNWIKRGFDQTDWTP